MSSDSGVTFLGFGSQLNAEDDEEGEKNIAVKFFGIGGWITMVPFFA